MSYRGKAREKEMERQGGSDGERARKRVKQYDDGFQPMGPLRNQALKLALRQSVQREGMMRRFFKIFF